MSPDCDDAPVAVAAGAGGVAVPGSGGRQERRTRDALDHDRQLKVIFDVLGTPSPAQVEEFEDERIRRQLRQLNTRPSHLAEQYEFAGVEAVALLSSMLDLNPAKRITAKDALAHPFFEPMPREWRELDGKPLEQYATEPMSKMTMHFESGGPSGRAELTSSELRRLIVAEAALYHE